MKDWKRLIYYLILNVVVSAATVLLVLNVWERTHETVIETPPPAGGQPTVVILPTGTPTAVEAAAAPASTATPAVLTYTVKTGDTLGAIAAAYGTTVEILISINNLPNPDSLSIGDKIFVPHPEPTAPAGSENAESATATPQGPTRTPPPTLPPGNTITPIASGVQVDVTIVTVIGAGVLEDERVVIRYDGDDELALLNWRLEDETGQAYVFPQLSLFKGGAISVYSRAGADSVVELYWGIESPVWESGEVVSLRDPQGNVQATARVP